MAKTKIAIACQGGGSQTAFTAGALKALLEANVLREFEVVSVSGTSGRAICGALVWYAFESDEDPVWGRLMRFWEDNTAQRWAEQSLNRFVVDALRLSNSGLLPNLRIPKSFHTDDDKLYHIPCIEMSAEVQRTPDFESRLGRSAGNINHLIAEGERCTPGFLEEPRATVRASPGATEERKRR